MDTNRRLTESLIKTNSELAMKRNKFYESRSVLTILSIEGLNVRNDLEHLEKCRKFSETFSSFDSHC